RLALRRRPHAVDDVVEALGLGDEAGGTGFPGSGGRAARRRGREDAGACSAAARPRADVGAVGTTIFAAGRIACRSEIAPTPSPSGRRWSRRTTSGAGVPIRRLAVPRGVGAPT